MVRLQSMLCRRGSLVLAVLWDGLGGGGKERVCPDPLSRRTLRPLSANNGRWALIVIALRLRIFLIPASAPVTAP